jgi:hypothetical protein
MCASHAPNCHFGSAASSTVLWCVHGVVFIINVHNSRTELRLWIRRGAVRCSGACLVFIFIIHVRHSRTKFLLWILLGALRCSGPGLLLAAPDCSWVAPGCSWAAPGCSWLLLTASGCSWLSLAVVDVNSRSKETTGLGSYAGIIEPSWALLGPSWPY